MYNHLWRSSLAGSSDITLKWQPSFCSLLDLMLLFCFVALKAVAEDETFTNLSTSARSCMFTQCHPCRCSLQQPVQLTSLLGWGAQVHYTTDLRSATKTLSPHPCPGHTFPALPSGRSSDHMAMGQVYLAGRSNGKQRQQMKMTLQLEQGRKTAFEKGY